MRGLAKKISEEEQKEMNSNVCTLSILIALANLTFACEEEKAPPPEEKKAEVAAPAEKSAEEKAKEEAEQKAIEEAQKKAEEAAAAEAKLQENPMTECCRALGQKGFVERSPEYMAASKVCGAAMEEKKELGDTLPAIEKELKGKTTPDECKP